MSSESRIWEIRPFGSMRGGGELVIGLCAFQSILSRLLYERNPRRAPQISAWPIGNRQESPMVNRRWPLAKPGLRGGKAGASSGAVHTLREVRCVGQDAAPNADRVNADP